MIPTQPFTQKLGIIAGGQLGKMLALAASSWDIPTYVLDKEADCPAAGAARHCIQGDPLNYDDVLRFGQQVDLLSFEIEHVNIAALKQLKREGKQVFPDPEILEMIQDKGTQKQFYQRLKLPSPDFQLLGNIAYIKDQLTSGTLQFPFVQKLRKGGYDGKGVAVIRSSEDLSELLDGPSVIENAIDIHREVSVIVARNGSGEVRCFPLVEMDFDHRANLVDRLYCPAGIDSTLQQQAETIAQTIVKELDYVGILAIEFFVDKNRKLWINEMAPRAHNSGHHTIEGNTTSQFEQQLRAIYNLPLGSTELKMPTVMLNLLGEQGYEGIAHYEGLAAAMALSGVKVHLYGKKMTKPFRKMGHVTVLGTTLEEADTKANLVKQLLKVRS